MTKKELIKVITDSMKALSIEDAFILSSILTPIISVEESALELHAYYSKCKSEVADTIIADINLIALTIDEEDKPAYYYHMQQSALAPIKEYLNEKRLVNLN